MLLDEWRKKEGLTYEDLARQLNFTNSKTYRFCKEDSNCIKLRDATIIVRLTGNQVGFEELLQGDC